MAKSSFWLKGAKGKFAGATIYDANGQSVMREIKSHIKNPRTKAQMVQRVISKTVMTQYSAMKGIVNHSFQGVTAGAKSMAHFASINNRATRSFVAELQEAGISLAEVFNFVPCKSFRFVPARAIISDGVLPQIYTNIATNGSAASINAPGIENTYQGVIAALGLQRGDQLTFVTSEKNSNGNYNFNVCRVILDPRNADGTPAPLSTAFIENGAIKNPSFRNEGSFAALTFDTTVKFAIQGGTVVTAGVIASRQSESDWLRSPCELAFNEASLGDDICSLEEAVARSIEKTPVYTDAERYLNNAGIGGPQAGGGEQAGMTLSYIEKTGDSSTRVAITSDTITSGELDGISGHNVTFGGSNMNGSWQYINRNSQAIADGVVASDGNSVVFNDDDIELLGGYSVKYNGETVFTIT